MDEYTLRSDRRAGGMMRSMRPESFETSRGDEVKKEMILHEYDDDYDDQEEQDEYEFTSIQGGPSLSYERKIRLHKYAENRALSCLALVTKSNEQKEEKNRWKHYDEKNDILLFQPNSNWTEFSCAKAITKDVFLDAEVVEDLNKYNNCTGFFDGDDKQKQQQNIYKQACIKWWAIKSGILTSKASDFYVLEHIGIESIDGEMTGCYLYQESLAEVGGMPHIEGNNLERSHFDSLICRFEKHSEQQVIISVAFQRPPPMISLFRRNPAIEMVFLFAKGLRNLLENPPEKQEIALINTSAWVRDKERQYCYICVRKFSPLFRRRHHCRMCGEVICWQCSSTLGVLTINCGPNDASTKQEQLSTNQPTIRVCTKCVVTNHHEKSTKDLASQKEFKEWITNAMIEQRVQEEDQQEKQCSLRNPFLDENIRESSRFQKNSQNISGFCEKDEPFYRLSFSGNQNILNDDYEEKTKAKNKQQDKPEYLYGNMNTLAHPASERDYSATTNDDEIYHLSSSNQDEVETKPTDKVQAASAWASDRNEVIAVSAALQELLYKVGGKVHFLVVGFSPNFKANVIVETLRELAPGIPYIGGTIARGACDENAWVIVNRHNKEGLLTLWGINDPDGTYTVVHMEYDQNDAKQKAHQATNMALTYASVEVEPEEKPAFVLTYACPLFVEAAIEGIRAATQCPIVGGCSADSNKSKSKEQNVSCWFQISSGSCKDYRRSLREQDGEWTEMGAAIAVCYPSVETRIGWFTCYVPVVLGNEYCIGRVTKATPKAILEIDSKPAAGVYQEWLNFASVKNSTDLSTIAFPRLGNMHPIGTILESESSNQAMSNTPFLDSEEGAVIINTTAVVTGINLDGSINVTSSIEPGSDIVMMETSAPLLCSSMKQMGCDGASTATFHQSETIGCLMFLSAGLQALLGHKNMAAMVGAFRDWTKGNNSACLMGMTTFGEIGNLSYREQDPHYDSLMFSSIMFSNRKRHRKHQEYTI